MAIEEDDDDNLFSSRYLIVRPENGGVVDLLRFVASRDRASIPSSKFIESSDEHIIDDDDDNELLAGDGGTSTPDHRWVIFVSIIVRKILSFLGKPMEWYGYLIEFLLNLLSLNANLLGLIYNLLHGTKPKPKTFFHHILQSHTLVSAAGRFF